MPTATDDELEAQLPQGNPERVPQELGDPLLSAESRGEAPEPTETTQRSRSFCGPCKSVWKSFRGSLSMAPSTPIVLRLLIPLSILLTHYIFYYGQTKPMWELLLRKHVHVSAQAMSLEARTTFDTLGLHHLLHYDVDSDKDVREFTYAYAIQELWKAKGMPGKLLPRFCAILLIFFSGAWPHVKLFLLLMTWWFATNTRRRTKALSWLSTLGKWSLADVLVVCVMVGVLHLDWTIDLDRIQQGVLENLSLLLGLLKQTYSATDLCSQLLHKGCQKPHKVDTITKCLSCRKFINEMVDHPDTARSTLSSILGGVDKKGDGFVTLRVLGLPGIYAFCLAVIMSIVLSLVIDISDVRLRRYQARLAREAQRRPLLASGDADDSDDDSEDLLSIASDSSLRWGVFHWKSRCATLSSVLTVGLVLAATHLPTLQRTVTGAIPTLLSEVMSINLDQGFSFRSLSTTIGAAGGYDYLLEATFSFFIVIGPILRSILTLIALILPESSSLKRHRFLVSIDCLGAFCAWEVFILAAFMVALLMPSITSTIIMKPQCSIVDGSGSCLSVSFSPQATMLLALAGGVLLIGVARVPRSFMPLTRFDRGF